MSRVIWLVLFCVIFQGALAATTTRSESPTLSDNTTKEWYYYDYYMDYLSDISIVCTATFRSEKELYITAKDYGDYPSNGLKATYSVTINIGPVSNIKALFASLSSRWSVKFSKDRATMYLINYDTKIEGDMCKEGCKLMLLKDRP